MCNVKPTTNFPSPVKPSNRLTSARATLHTRAGDFYCATMKHGVRFIDLTGKKFGFLTVLSFHSKDKAGASIFKCRCDCGSIKICYAGNLKTGKTKSCGCVDWKQRKTHGEASIILGRTPEYNCWAGMIDRCSRVSSKYYGGSGVKVCDRWRKYENFLLDMGRKPSPNHSIDRIDNNGNYEPSNCRWATDTEQANNTSRNKKWEFKGTKKTMAEISRETGMNYWKIGSRIRRGISMEQATLTTNK